MKGKILHLHTTYACIRARCMLCIPQGCAATMPCLHEFCQVIVILAGQTVLVVIHGGVLNACYRHAMGCSYPGKHVNAAINTIKIEEERWAVVSWNNTDHLSTTGYLASAFGGGSGGG